MAQLARLAVGADEAQEHELLCGREVDAEGTQGE